MKKTLIKIGNVVAILLMFSPIVIASLNTKIDKYWWLFLMLSICYDFYMYSNILKSEYIDNIEERYKKHIKPNKILGMEISDKEHIKTYEKFIEEIINSLK